MQTRLAKPSLFVLFWGVFGYALCLPQPFAGRDIATGKTVDWDPKKEGKPSVIVFLSQKCPCSRSHAPDISELSKKYPEFRFLGIHSNRDEEPALVDFYFKEAALPFPVVEDTGFRIANAFGAFKTPHAFVVGKDGACLFQGGVTDSKQLKNSKVHYLDLALADIRAGKEPAEKEVRTLGCIIKR